MTLILNYREGFSLASLGRRHKFAAFEAAAADGALDFSNPFQSGWL